MINCSSSKSLIFIYLLNRMFFLFFLTESEDTGSFHGISRENTEYHLTYPLRATRLWCVYFISPLPGWAEWLQWPSAGTWPPQRGRWSETSRCPRWPHSRSYTDSAGCPRPSCCTQTHMYTCFSIHCVMVLRNYAQSKKVIKAATNRVFIILQLFLTNQKLKMPDNETTNVWLHDIFCQVTGLHVVT